MKILSSVYQALIDHAIAESPRECCGFLGGVDGLLCARLPAENVAADPEHYYEISPYDQYSIRRKMRNNGCDFVAVYHSHPHGKAEPSTTDLRFAFALARVIVTPQEVRAFHALESKWRPIELDIVSA